MTAERFLSDAMLKLGGKEDLGRQDSNLRMPGSKPGGLPLADVPRNQRYLYRMRLCAYVLPENPFKGQEASNVARGYAFRTARN